MREWLSRCTTTVSASLILVSLTLVPPSTAGSEGIDRGELPAANAQVRAGELVDMRQLLKAATGGASEHGRRGWATAAAAGDSIYRDGFEMCGDGAIDAASEQCDRTDLGGATCLTAGFMAGTVSCDATCHLDTTQCSGACPAACATDNDCGVCGPCIQLGGGVGVCVY